MKHVKHVEKTRTTGNIVKVLHAQEPMAEEEKNAVSLLDDDTLSNATKALEQRLLSIPTIDQQMDIWVEKMLITRKIKPSTLDAEHKFKLDFILEQHANSKGNAENIEVIDEAKRLRELIRDKKAIIQKDKELFGLSSDVTLEDALKMMEEHVQSIADAEERNQQLAILTTQVRKVFDNDALLKHLEAAYAAGLEDMIKKRENLQVLIVQLLQDNGISEVDAKAFVYGNSFQAEPLAKKPTSELSEKKDSSPFEKAKTTSSSNSKFFPQPPKLLPTQKVEQPYSTFVDPSPEPRATQQVEPRFSIFVDPDPSDSVPFYLDKQEKESGLCRCVIL